MVSEVKGSETVLTGLLEDRSALFGVIAQIEALGLELLELRQIRARRTSRESRDDRHRRFDELSPQLYDWGIVCPAPSVPPSPPGTRHQLTLSGDNHALLPRPPMPSPRRG